MCGSVGLAMRLYKLNIKRLRNRAEIRERRRRRRSFAYGTGCVEVRSVRIGDRESPQKQRTLDGTPRGIRYKTRLRNAVRAHDRAGRFPRGFFPEDGRMSETVEFLRTNRTNLHAPLSHLHCWRLGCVVFRSSLPGNPSVS